MAPSLDSRRNNRNKPRRRCGYFTATRTVVDGGQTYKEYARMYCKLWSCPDCGPYLVRRFMSRLAVVAQENDLSRMLTLTLDPKRAPKGEAAVTHLKGTWAKFRTYLRRKFKESISYVWVMEFHKSGLPHLHILVDRYIDQRWISANWAAIGGGRIADIRRVKDLEKAGWYLSKYLSKDALLRVPPGMRRYGTSRDIKLFPKAENEGWSLTRSEIDTFYTVNQNGAQDVLTTHAGELQSFRRPAALDLDSFDPAELNTESDLPVPLPVHDWTVKRREFQIGLIEEQWSLDDRGLWQAFDPEKHELPPELQNLPAGISVLGFCDGEKESNDACSDLRQSFEQGAA